MLKLQNGDDVLIKWTLRHHDDQY